MDYVKSVNNSNEMDAVEKLESFFAKYDKAKKIGRNVIEDYFIALESIKDGDDTFKEADG